MPKVAQQTLEEFGKAVRRARSLKGWQLDQLSTAMEGANASRSYLSNLEKGKRQISPPTVGRLIRALDLDESWIDRFLDDDVSPEAEETPVDRETERLLRLKAKDDNTPDAAEDLLILLANTHALGQYADTMTAYQALKGALEAAQRIRERGAMPDNTGGQLQAVMAEVARLNDLGKLDEAAAELDDAMKRVDQERDAIFRQQLNQDRLRNDPAMAAKRLIRDLHRQAPPGGVVKATQDLLTEWRESGEKQGDPFELRVALALARTNYEKAKRSQKGAVLTDLGNCHLVIGERASDTVHLRAAEKAYRAANNTASKKSDPQNWGIHQANLGNVLANLGERAQDGGLLRDAVAAYEAALTVWTKDTAPLDWAKTKCNLGNALRNLGERAEDHTLLREAVAAYENALTVWTKDTAPLDWAMTKNNLGNALRNLGERAQDDALLRDAVAAFEDALTVRTKDAAPMKWATTQNNLGLALRWRGAVTQDAVHYDVAETAFTLSIEVCSQDDAPVFWARTQWNLGDLALARFALDPDPALLDRAESHVRVARAVFAEGSDHQTERCDDLLRRIAEARKSA